MELMKTKNKFGAVLIIAIIFGLLIGWIDSSPNWDDTGITAAAIFIIAASFGFIIPKRAWVWALAVSIWVPLFNIILHHNFTAFLALIISFIGAYLGSFFRKIFRLS